jgi:hypothetical protein
LESGVATPEFATLLGVAARVERSARQTVDQALSWWLHQWGFPSRGDVGDIKRAVARVEHRLRDLSQEIEDLRDSERPPEPD